jgi:molybdate-binding protein/DNA-binding XRE family transcriptional regulator
MAVETRLAAIRQGRGLSAAELARRTGLSRQTVYAIEAGNYVPNTAVALLLARRLEVSVDDLFALREPDQPQLERLCAELLAARAPEPGIPVRLGQVGERWVAVPGTAAPYFLPAADGILAAASPSGPAKARRSLAAVDLCATRDSLGRRLVLAGCDPALGLLAQLVEHGGGPAVVTAPAASRLALDWLKQGLVHVAGTHLEDPASGEFNLPYLRRQFASEPLVVVTFASWEEGLVTARGNPRRIRKITSLAAKGVRFVNREPGSGSRLLLDSLLAVEGLKPKGIAGYETVAWGHLAAAYAVHSGAADACLATPSAARAFGLDFVPLRAERFDLVMRAETAAQPGARVLLDALQRAALRRKLESLAGYDTSTTGRLIEGWQ